MKEMKCYRCGKTESVKEMKLRKSWECPHCHAVMVLDLATQRKLKYVRMLFVAVVVSLLMYGCSPAGNSDQLCRFDRYLFACDRDHAVFRSALSGADGQIIRTSVYAGGKR